MSTYLQGSQDYIPQIQPFQPDLNFYSGVLATKQSQYNEGLSKVGSIYNSAFNSAMTRSDNLERRDKYFKTIEQQVQKVAGMDLSIDQNVSSAKTLFDPIINDKHIVKDMVYTKGLQDSFQRAEQFRNCVDPEKCGGSYWDEGVQALQYAQEEFQKASPDDSLKYSAPEYVPFQNVIQKAIKAAKDAGFNVSYDYKSADGRYNVTDTNGQLLLGQDGQGVLPQYLYGLFGNDSNVQKMYSTQAYVQRKNYAKSNAAKFNGNEDAAESEYLHNIMLQTVPKIEKAKNDLTDLRDKVNVDKKALEILAKNNPGEDDVQQAYNQLQDILTNTESTAQYHEQVSNLINTAPNLNDLQSLRSRVDNVVANANFMNTINSAATEYALGTAKHEMKADPYALAAYNSSLDLSKSKQLKNYDNQIWLQQHILTGDISVDDNGNPIPSNKANLSLSASGLTSQDLLDQGISSLDKAGVKKATQLGAFNKPSTEAASNFVLPNREAEPFQSAYNENSKTFNFAAEQALTQSKDFLANTIGSIINTFKNADATEGKNAPAIKAKLVADIQSIVSGTNIDPNALVRGEISLDNLGDAAITKMTNVAKEIRTKNTASRVYADNLNDTSFLKMQGATQTAENLYKDRNLDFKKAVSTSLADYASKAQKGELTPQEYQKQQILHAAFVNPNGGMLTPAEAKSKYVKGTFALYGGVKNPNPQTEEEDNYYTAINNKAFAAAGAAFDANYIPALKRIDSQITAFNTPPLSKDQGGMDAAQGAIPKIFNGAKPLDPNTRLVRDMVLDFANNPNGNPLIITGVGKEGLVASQNNAVDPGKVDLFSKITDKIKTGDSKDLHLITTTEFVPRTFDQSAFSLESTYDKARFGTPNDQSSFPGEFTDPAVMVKMTVGEAEYRKLYGIKASDPVSEQDRSLVVKTIPNAKGFPASLTPFLQGIQESPQEIYMKKIGNSINLDLGYKGSGVIERGEKGNLVAHLAVPVFNVNTGEQDTIKQSYTLDRELKMDGAYPWFAEQLNSIQKTNQDNVRLYTNQHARSN